MSGRPTLALLIPAYNAAAHLARLLKSAACQSEPFDEIWVYDDASTDGTASVAQRHGARIIQGEQNCGCTAAKTILVNRTKCDWVHFHDADDLLLSNFVESAQRWMRQSDVDVVVFSCEERWETTGDFISLSHHEDSFLASDPVGYTIRCKINAISGIYRRTAFLSAGGFDLDPDVLYNEDQAYHCKLARAGLRFRADPTVTVVNLRRDSSMWISNQQKAFRAHYHVMRKAFAGPGGERHREEIAKSLWHVVASAGAQLDWRTADDAAALAMRAAGPSHAPSSVTFKVLCQISPRFALRARELLIRAFRPKQREGYPGWRAPIGLL